MSKLKQTKGFTLIELVIVLAIAALILAAVFLAIAGAQRAQRDTQRRNIAGRTASAMQAYESNNNGSVPAPATVLGGNYLQNITDPDTNAIPIAGAVGVSATAGSGIEYTGRGKCTLAAGNKVGPTVAATARDYAVVFWSEAANASECLDNQ